MAFNFVIDRISKDKMYPNLAQWEAIPYTPEWRQFGQHYPNVVPLRLEEYCTQHGYPLHYNNRSADLSNTKFYPIALEFFNFDIDYFGLITLERLSQIRTGEMRVLFYYHEGDNPQRIKDRLDQLCDQHNLPCNCYRFVSGNTAADSIPGFVWFSDFELWFWQRNRHHAPVTAHTNERKKEFTVLNRTHKTWRATIMADMFRKDILNNSYWSYGTGRELDDSENPIEVDTISPKLRWHRQKFIAGTPIYCDSLDFNEQNNHSMSVEDHFKNAYCNIVVETHWDADQSGGAFITEKTFKPIKNGQLFVVAGAVGGLSALRKLGYRTFDSVIDNSYDFETNNTQRWLKLRDTLLTIQKNLPDIYKQCLDDIQHNQQLFCANKSDRLNILHQRLTHE